LKKNEKTMKKYRIIYQTLDRIITTIHYSVWGFSEANAIRRGIRQLKKARHIPKATQVDVISIEIIARRPTGLQLVFGLFAAILVIGILYATGVLRAEFLRPYN